MNADSVKIKGWLAIGLGVAAICGGLGLLVGTDVTSGMFPLVLGLLAVALGVAGIRSSHGVSMNGLDKAMSRAVVWMVLSGAALVGAVIWFANDGQYGPAGLLVAGITSGGIAAWLYRTQGRSGIEDGASGSRR